MYKELSKRESFLIFIFIVSLIIITVFPTGIDIPARRSGPVKNVISGQDKLSTPYLPPEKIEIEQLLILIQQRSFHSGNAYRSELLSLVRHNPLMIPFTILLFTIFCRISRNSCCDPVRKRIITYIHNKEDHK